MLNPEQMKAVNSKQPRILCMAGAGTGKTRVLTERILRLIKDGVDPKNIAAITFTRKAAGEMRERLGSNDKLNGCNIYKLNNLKIDTFHSFFLDILRQKPETFDRNKNFTFVNPDDAKKLKKVFDRDMQEYYYYLHKLNAIDVDMIQPLFLEHFDDLYDHHYTHVLIDEFQDTDDVQFEIIEKMNPDNLFIVGDVRQSIYSFRGAKIENIRKYMQDEKFEQINLVTNYRSDKNVVEYANQQMQQYPSLKAFSEDRGGVDITGFNTYYDEVGYIANNIKYSDFKNIAILTRTNRQKYLIKSLLDACGIICQEINNNDILDDYSKLFDIIDVAHNPNDIQKIKNTINYPEQMISMKDFRRAEAKADLFEQPMFNVLPSETTEKYRNIQADDTMTASDLIEMAANYLGIKIYPELFDKIELWELEQEAFELEISWEEFSKYRQFKDVMYERITADDDSEKKVTVMTMHSSKGLEFDTVFLPYMSSKNIPMGKADLEEEKRLFYVASTRAKHDLYITYTDTKSEVV